MTIEGNFPRLAVDLAALGGAVVADRVRAQMYAAGAQIVETAQEMLGQEHPGLWAPLEASTRARRAAEGYPEDTPLVREGDLRAAIKEVHRDQESIEVGIADDDPALHHGAAMEKGFVHYASGRGVDPRPFLGPAAETVFDALPERVRRAVALAVPESP